MTPSTQVLGANCGYVGIESAWEEDDMQAAVVPAVNGSWQVKDVPQPQPGPNQVLVKMHASGICYTDVHETLGTFRGNFLEFWVTSPWARSWPWRPMLPTEK